MKTFFTADSHFNHHNIIKYCNRPFQSTVDMNDTIINNWNRVVDKNDIVYHLGDFAFGHKEYHFRSVFDRLNGSIIFIEGNHDSLAMANQHRFHAYRDGYHEIKIGNQFIVLNHYPQITWNKKHRGAFMLHGHCHYNLEVTKKESQHIGKILDVGMDGNSFTPYEFEDIVNIMAKKPINDSNKLLHDHHESH